MRSWKLRKLVINLSYAAVLLASLSNPGTLRINGIPGLLVKASAAALFAASLYAAVAVHSMFPGKHDEPGDFGELLTSGPYAYCRHPFYLSLILNQLSIPLFFGSLEGLAAFLLFLPGWLLLIRVEERELLEHWGERYRRYMEEVPALIPLPPRLAGVGGRRSGGEEG